MPTLVLIEGIKISMYDNDHEPPHVHALTADAAAIFEIRASRLIVGRGRFTRREMRIIASWIEENRDALLALWEAR